MKNIFKIVLLLLLGNYNAAGQSTETLTSQEIEENVNTSDNVTSINLFNIDFDGKKIPITISYNHTGIKVKDKPGNMGYVWSLNNIGYINRTVNDKNDSNPTVGWFSAANPDFSNVTTSDACSASCPGTFSYLGPDLSPDYFSLSTINGNNFDFIFKKNSSGSPIPVILSNQNSYKINTNFANLANNSGVCFNVIDKEGINYDFINGPNLQDSNRGGLGEIRNNYYLQTVKNLNNTDIVNIEYNTVAEQKRVYYRIGFNYYSGPSDTDWNNNVVQHLRQDYYFVDESRLDLKKITSKNSIVEFSYLNNDAGKAELDEINITDINGTYITGYKFEYEEFQGTSSRTLIKISKYNVTKTNADPIYEFNYNPGQDFFNEIGQYEDYFGYNNSIFKSNLMPFAVRDDINTNLVLPAGNYEPNIDNAQEHCLHQIINKYGGITEFTYRIKREISDHYGPIYGGGILIDSKKIIPNVGATKITQYTYGNLSGYVIMTGQLSHHYCVTLYPKKFYSLIPVLDEASQTLITEPSLPNIQQQGSFFAKVYEFTYDFNNMTQLLSGTIKDYIPDYEGLFRKPLIKKEQFLDGGNLLFVKTTEYQYSYQTMESINIAKMYIQRRNFNGGVTWYTTKSAASIPVNRIKLIEKKETTTANSQTLENITSYSYVNADSNIIRSVSQTESFGANMEKRYYYANDVEVSTDPYNFDLVAKNLIGVPMLEQSFKGTEKLSEEKMTFAKDVSTSNLLLPKNLYSKKGTDSVASLEKKMTYDLYDDMGNLLQYTTENGISVSTIWGYNKSKPIAELENVLYSNIPTLTVTDLQTKSNADNDNCYTSLCKEEILRVALNNLRGLFPASIISSFTYNPVVGITSKMDAKGDRVMMEYDELNRLKIVRDHNNNIITENQYHFLTQN